MKVLLIDDDKEAMKYYITALGRNRITVDHQRKPEGALQALEKTEDQYDLIILDSAMPPGKLYANKQTDAGIQTGQLIFNDIRAKWPKIPILILTNFFGLEWLQTAARLPNVQTDRKINVPPSKLVEIVRRMIKDSKK